MKFTLIFLLILFGCSGEPKYTGKELYFMAKEVDSSVELVGITDPSKRILCQNYGEGCVKGSGRRLKVRKVELIGVEFESTELAQKEARRLNQYYVRNWLLDDVNGEPVLESFVKKVYGAKSPLEEDKSSKKDE